MHELRAAGHTVICDRSLLSTMVYQNLGLTEFNELLAVCKVPPLEYDHALVFVASASVTTQRLSTRSALDPMDKYFMAHIDRVIAAYNLHSTTLYPDCEVIDTTELSEYDVYLAVRRYING